MPLGDGTPRWSDEERVRRQKAFEELRQLDNEIDDTKRENVERLIRDIRKHRFSDHALHFADPTDRQRFYAWNQGMESAIMQIRRHFEVPER